MKCIKPFIGQTGAYGCGHCLPCRVQKRRTWTARILLEAIDHGPDNCSFVTLTYEKDRRDLEPVHFQKWLKRLRKSVSPNRLRFYGVGEYGDTSWRPHYHAALFGYGPCVGGSTVKGACQCRACLGVRETWGFGHVMVAQLSMASAQYIAGYVTKKMTHRSDIRLLGREPEFARMSLRPGIGAIALHNVASDMMRFSMEDRGDVPTVLRFGGKPMPLAPYLRRKLRLMVGLEEKAPAEARQFAANQLQLLRAYSWAIEKPLSEVWKDLYEPASAELAGRQIARGHL